MKKIKKFEMFGKKYRTEQFSAIKGLQIMTMESVSHPCKLLAQTQILIGQDTWADLEDPAILNEHVTDTTNVLAPRLVLNGLMSIVHEFNFDFLNDWKGVKIPSRFLDNSTSVKSNHVEPMASQLIQDGAATLKELEEYYSLEDAFKMFDTIMVKGVTQALSQEAAMKKNKH